ncbi:kinetochore protein NDC80 homolog isoform X4 [Hyaena hyaena]|uniref:kinetochore protein NDC80 homolog isoform X4 n=1 Tax=Hyaena hyaena TaxID=95912 RepID=UPI0019251514|nr:kinetochore protein NDC80 homolog isoform X4 [Hyaena hyaena]
MKRSSVSTGGAGRLSMQELRSQDFNKQSLHTPQTKEKPGFGKLSINKPTSERKVSLFGKRTSGHGSRNSQFGIFSSSEKIKDPRPLNDKAFIQQCIRQLCELHNAMKESSPLFDDGQSWGEETEDGIMHNKLFLDYTIKCYESFMTGADSFEEMNTELQSKLKDLFNVDASKLESLAAKNKALNEQIARLEQEREKEPNRLESLRKLKTSLQADVQKYQAYMSNLESHSAILDQKLNGLDEEISRVELEYETMKQENTRLQNIVDNQKYSVADIERINHERNELQQTINKLTKDLESEQQQLWNEELKYARGKEAIETQLSEYHKLARKLKLIPKSAENSKGYDFEIKFNPEAGANCLVKYRAQVYVPLKELLNQTEEEINKALNKKMSLEDTLEQLNTMITESRRGVRTLKEEVQKLDDLYQQKVKEAEEEDKKCANELESLEKHKHLLESAVNDGLSEAMNELDAIQREYQLVVQTTTEERRKVGNNLQRLLEMVATHVGSVEKHLEEQIAKVDREYEEYMSEDLLENIREIGDKYKKKAALLKASDE